MVFCYSSLSRLVQEISRAKERMRIEGQRNRTVEEIGPFAFKSLIQKNLRPQEKMNYQRGANYHVIL